MRVGYPCVQAAGAQAQSGLGTDAQYQAVERETQARGWQIVARITDDAVSGTVPTSQRPKLAAALRADGHSYGQIATALTEAGIVTPGGNTQWSRSSVQSLLRTAEHDRQARLNAQHHADKQHKN